MKRKRKAAAAIQPKPQYEAGVDLFRILGLLFVNGLHACLYNGFYSVPQVGAEVWLANTFRWLFYGCNAMFMLLTGYLKSTKPWNRRYYKGLVTVLVGYVLTCIISYPVRYFLIGEKDGLSVWLERFFTFSNYAWYVEMYIGLILFSPIINLALQQITDRRKLLLLAGSCLFVTSMHSVTAVDLIPNYWSAMYPVTLYILGAVIRKLQPKFPAWSCLLTAALTAMGLGLTSLLTTDQGFSKGFNQGYGGFWVTIMVAALFMGIYRLQVSDRVSKVLRWLSGGVFEGYILSRLFDVWVYGLVPQWHTPKKYPLIFACITIPVFIISILAGKWVHNTSVAIVEQINYRKTVASDKSRL